MFATRYHYFVDFLCTTTKKKPSIIQFKFKDMKNKIFAVIGGVVCLVALGLNIQYAGNGYGIITHNQHSEVLAQANTLPGKGGDTTVSPCADKSNKGFGECYELHSIGCIDEIAFWPPKISRGDKLRCRLKQPYDKTASCSSDQERACGGTGTGTTAEPE